MEVMNEIVVLIVIIAESPVIAPLAAVLGLIFHRIDD